MKQMFLALTLLLGSVLMNGQVISFATIDQYLIPSQYPPRYLLADSVNVRECGSVECGHAGILRIGEKFIISDASESIDTIRGLASRWYRIESDRLSGWIWGGFIASYAFGSDTDAQIKFVFGPEKTELVNGYPRRIHLLKAYSGNRELDRIEIREGYDFESASSIGRQGLQGIKDVIALSVPCHGGCGCSTGNLYVFWDGVKFGEIQEAMGTADAWASGGTEFIFPSDIRGIPGVVIRLTDEYIDSSNDEEEVTREEVIEYFRLSGLKMVPDESRTTSKRTYNTTM